MDTLVASPTQVSCGVVDLGILGSVSAQVWKQMVADVHRTNDELLEEIPRLIATERENVEAEFNEQMRLWKTDRSATSSTTAIAMHPAYQRIIGLGRLAMPLILRELNRELDHWFWALRAISGEDPVPPEHRGKIKQMAADWLTWGREKGYVR